MAERKTVSRAVKNPVKRKLTRAEKKEIAAVIQAAKGDGKPHTAQQTIPYLQMYPDGICRVTEKKYSKSLVFEDINYQLAQADDKTAIFENWCDFLNYFDASVSVQLSFINQGARKEKAQAAIEIPAQDDAFNSIRKEYADMLKNQLEKGNNGLEKCKYITFSIEADNLAAAKARLSRIETDVLNNFKVLGVTARPMNGQERLNVLHGIFHPEGEPFRFSWDWLVPSGLSTKDFIAPSSFRFGDGRTFRMGRKLGAVSFLEILAPELNDRMLSDILDLENGIIVNLHIRSIDQSEAIKTNTLGTVIGYLLYKIIHKKARADTLTAISIIVLVTVLGGFALGILFINHTELFMLSSKEIVVENKNLVQDFIDTQPTVSGKFVKVNGNVLTLEKSIHSSTDTRTIMDLEITPNSNIYICYNKIDYFFSTISGEQISYEKIEYSDFLSQNSNSFTKENNVRIWSSDGKTIDNLVITEWIE